MAGVKSPEGMKKTYFRRYGEEEGLKRWTKKWGAKASEPPEPDPPMSFDPGEMRPQRTGEKAPNRKKPSKAELQLVVGAGVYYADGGLAWFYPPWQDDRLSDAEIGMLSKALANEIIDSPKLLAWAAKAQKATKHGELLKAIILISLPRMAKHGMLPSGLSGQGNSQSSPVEPAVPMESGPAYGSDRDDGVGQVSSDSAIAGLAPLFSGPEEQSGLGQVSGIQDGTYSGSHERSAGEPAGFTTSL